MGRRVFPWGWPLRSSYYEEDPEAAGAGRMVSGRRHPLSNEFGTGLCEHGKWLLSMLTSDEEKGTLNKEGRRSLMALRAAHDGTQLPDVSDNVAHEEKEDDPFMRAVRRIDF